MDLGDSPGKWCNDCRRAIWRAHNPSDEFEERYGTRLLDRLDRDPEPFHLLRGKSDCREILRICGTRRQCNGRQRRDQLDAHAPSPTTIEHGWLKRAA